MAQSYTSHGPRVSETKAKQATRGRHVFWILVISLLLSGAALFVVWAYNARNLASVEPARERLPPEGHSQLFSPTKPKPPSPRDL